jgi:hypothetical protein
MRNPDSRIKNKIKGPINNGALFLTTKWQMFCWQIFMLIKQAVIPKVIWNIFGMKNKKPCKMEAMQNGRIR